MADFEINSDGKTITQKGPGPFTWGTPISFDNKCNDRVTVDLCWNSGTPVNGKQFTVQPEGNSWTPTPLNPESTGNWGIFLLKVPGSSANPAGLHLSALYLGEEGKVFPKIGVTYHVCDVVAIRNGTDKTQKVRAYSKSNSNVTGTLFSGVTILNDLDGDYFNVGKDVSQPTIKAGNSGEYTICQRPKHPHLMGDGRGIGGGDNDGKINVGGGPAGGDDQ